MWWQDNRAHKSDLVIMVRDTEAKKGGYTAQSYIDVLEEQMLRCWQPGLIFMQDNAPIHAAYAVRQ
jgi:hypothetical protein